MSTSSKASRYIMSNYFYFLELTITYIVSKG